MVVRGRAVRAGIGARVVGMSVNHRPVWAPDDVDIETPSPARMYDYYLDGSHNFAADRALADQVLQVWPDLPHVMRANRAFLRRALTFLTRQGVDQFVDLGSGIPTVGNVHEIVWGLNPAARTVYVDNDLVAVSHSRSLLAAVPGAAVVHADLRDPDAVLHDPALLDLIDLRRPVAVLMFAVLHFVPDADDPAWIVAAYRAATTAGSYLALSHATADYQPARMGEMQEVYRRATAGMNARSREQLATLLSGAGYEMVPPGVVDMIHWRPEPGSDLVDPLGGDLARYSAYAAVGRRP
jgi:S-adenosyl methyltransferase